MRYFFQALFFHLLFSSVALGQNSYLKADFKSSLNLDYKVHNVEIATMEYFNMLREVTTFTIDSLKYHFDYQLVRGREKLTDFTLLISLWLDSTQNTSDEKMVLKYELINNSTKQTAAGFTYSNPKSEFEKRRKEKIKETAVKTISVIFHLKLPPHSYLEQARNKENTKMTISIDEYFDCVSCENEILPKVFTDLVSNMLVFKQITAIYHPKRQYFNFFRNYQSSEKVSADIQIKGEIKIMKSIQEIQFKLVFQSTSSEIPIFQPENVEVKLSKTLVDKNNFTQFINEVNSIITAFYIENM
jgi:hypothetical protein